MVDATVVVVVVGLVVVVVGRLVVVVGWPVVVVGLLVVVVASVVVVVGGSVVDVVVVVVVEVVASVVDVLEAVVLGAAADMSFGGSVAGGATTAWVHAIKRATTEIAAITRLSVSLMSCYSARGVALGR